MKIKPLKSKEIILHVGLHKTGTTSIQQTLFSNKNNEILKENGYIYPKCWPANHSIPVYSIFCDYPEKYHINIKEKYTKQEIKEINNQYSLDLESEINSSDQSKIIISGEDISLLTYNNLNKLKEYLTFKFTKNIKIIIYVRNPLSWSISAIQEIIKSGHSYEISFSSILTNIENLFQNRIKKFINVFGKKSIIIYNFEKSIQHEYGLVGHFLNMIGLANGDINKFNIIRSNDSNSLIAIEILSYINGKMPLIENGKLNKKRTSRDFVPLLNINGPKFDISISDKKKIFEVCKDDIVWLKNNFGIDYSNLKEPENDQLNYIFTKEIANDIKSSYLKLSNTIRDLVMEYLMNKSNIIKDKNSRSIIKDLLDKFEISE